MSSFLAKKTYLLYMFILINMTNSPSRKSVVFETSVKPSLGCYALTEDSRTTVSGCKNVQSAKGSYNRANIHNVMYSTNNGCFKLVILIIMSTNNPSQK